MPPPVVRSRFTLLSVCLIFIFGWFSGSLFLLFFYATTPSSNVGHGSSSNDAEDSSSHVGQPRYHHLRTHSNNNEGLISSRDKILAANTNISSTIKDHLILPTFKQYIFLIWPLRVIDFSIINYKALESILIHYPKSKIRILLPSQSEYHHYKTDLLFSSNHFLKYHKKGYDILVKSTSDYEFSEDLGVNYWNQIEYILNGMKSMVPFHLSMFLGLHMLYRQGGIFTDFTFLFNEPLNSNLFRHGWYINTFCYDTEVKGKQLCPTSTFLTFSPKHKIIHCMLKKYNDKHFISCLFQDALYGGKECIQAAMVKCFSHDKNNVNDISSSAVLETFGNDARKSLSYFHHKNTTLSETNRKSSLVYWLGATACLPASNFVPLKDSVLQAIVGRNNELVLDTLDTDQSINQHVCSHYSKPADDVNVYNYHIYETSCTPSFVLPEFIRTTSSYFSYLLSSHPQVLKPLDSCYYYKDRLRYTQRHLCYPFIEAQEAYVSMAASFLLSMDYESPYLLKQDNPNMRAIILVRHPVDRMYASYIEAYRKDSSIPPFDALVHNGTAKFAKFGILRQLITNDSTVATSNKNSNHTQAIQQIIQLFYQSDFEGSSLVNSLFMQSLYAPVVMHYIQVLGLDSVLLVTHDQITAVTSRTVQDASKERVRFTMKRVFEFLGLQTFELPSHLLKPQHKDDDDDSDIPESHRMSRVTFKKLAVFFAPFVEALSLVSNTNLTSWTNRMTAATLAPDSIVTVLPAPATNSPASTNESATTSTTAGTYTMAPSEWYELDYGLGKLGAVNKKSWRMQLIHALLPKKTGEDRGSGFNTTINMLTMF